MKFFKLNTELPKPEEREAFFDFVSWLLPEKLRNKELDDAYIYYLSIRTSIIIGVILSIVYWASLIFNFSIPLIFIEIKLSQTRFFREFSWQFTLVYGAILLIFIHPYYFKKFKKNIDLKIYDSLWWSPRLSIEEPIKSYIKYFAFTILILLGFASAGCVGEVLWKRGVYQVNSLIFLNIFYLLALPLLNLSLILSRIVLSNIRQRFKH